MTEGKAPVTTTDAGVPAPSDEFSLSVGPEGPCCCRTITSSRDGAVQLGAGSRTGGARQGSGAFGFFEATEDINQWCKADFLKKGTRTPMLARFSTVAGELGSPETWRVAGGSLPLPLSQNRT